MGYANMSKQAGANPNMVNSGPSGTMDVGKGFLYIVGIHPV